MTFETLQGVVQRITYKSPDEGNYTVFRFNADGYADLVTCVATLPGIQEGGNLRLMGRWVMHARYGRNFEVTSIVQLLPANAAGMISYIGSGLFKGVRKRRAEAIVKRFGLESLQIIAEKPELLVEAGINPTLAGSMQKTLLENRESERLLLYLQSHGLTAGLAMRIYRHYKDEYQGDMIALIEANPYRLAEDVFGIGFRTADRLARQLNIAADAPIRLKLGLTHALSRAAEAGHCFLPQGELLQEATQQLEVAEEPLLPVLAELVAKRELIAEIVDEAQHIFHPAFYHAEVGTVRRLAVFGAGSQTEEAAHEDTHNLHRSLRGLEQVMGLELSPGQRNALRDALANQLQVITGGPGTGKTTLLRSLLLQFRRMNLRCLVAAPTGRAARRLREVTGAPAQTIHRLLEYAPGVQGMTFQRNEDNPLPADVVIVDETSMVDIILFYNLLKALPPACRLILVGDKDQLPSVGPGQVLRDLISSGTVPVAHLRTIFRQASESKIIVNAHRINRGQYPIPGDPSDDFFFIKSQDPTQTLQEIVELCSVRLPKYLGIDPIEDIQVLCPMRRGVCGVDNLNYALQQALNPRTTPQEHDDPTRTGGLGRFRMGDKVMQLRNNYDKGVFNGDIGTVAYLDAEQDEMLVEYPEAQGSIRIAYNTRDREELTLAYAISVHKAQGSEYPAVVMPILAEHSWMLQRNLLYTGVTRAKRLFVLVGEPQVLHRTIAKESAFLRHTGLRRRLEELV